MKTAGLLAVMLGAAELQAPVTAPIGPSALRAALQFEGPPAEFVAPVVVLFIIVSGVLLFPLARAMARRLEGKTVDAGLRDEIDALHQRVTELEQVEARIADLENRAEFSERSLARQREPAPESRDRA